MLRKLTYTVKKAARNSDVDNGGANQTTWGPENSYSHVLWFCATVVNIGIWRIPTLLLTVYCTRIGLYCFALSAVHGLSLHILSDYSDELLLSGTAGSTFS
jgi:hypothetical protein